MILYMLSFSYSQPVTFIQTWLVCLSSALKNQYLWTGLSQQDGRVHRAFAESRSLAGMCWARSTEAVPNLEMPRSSTEASPSLAGPQKQGSRAGFFPVSLRPPPSRRNSNLLNLNRFLAARISSATYSASVISFSSSRRFRRWLHCGMHVIRSTSHSSRLTVCISRSPDFVTQFHCLFHRILLFKALTILASLCSTCGPEYFAFFSSYNLFFSIRVRQGFPLPLTSHPAAKDRGFMVLYLWSKIICILPSLLCHNFLFSPRFRHAVPLPLISHSPLWRASNRGLIVEYLRSEVRCILLISESAFLASISLRSFSASHPSISSWRCFRPWLHCGVFVVLQKYFAFFSCHPLVSHFSSNRCFQEFLFCELKYPGALTSSAY